VKCFSVPAPALTLLPLWCCCLAAGPPASPPKSAAAKLLDQGRYDPRLQGYLAPEGVKVEIVAEEPVVINPVGMAFGTDGTLYVLEWVCGEGPAKQGKLTFTFKDGTRHTVPVMTKPVMDRVKVLRDSKGKGVYDQSRVVLQEELPSGILVHDGWLYLSGRGSVRRYRLADLARYEAPQEPEPTDPARRKADPRRPQPEVIARGFGGLGQHQVSGLTLGHDGLLYVTVGAGDSIMEGSDGSRATVLRSGAVFRCRPDGSRLEVFALGFCNPYRDVAPDPAGNLFHADNDGGSGPRFAGCRLLYLPEGGDYGWRLRPGSTGCDPDPVRCAPFGGRPGTLPPLLKTGRGSPAGLLAYHDSRFPEPYRGLLYYPDVLRRLVRAYRVERRGAGFAVAQEMEFLKSGDPLFRPCQMVVGPDGAMYVCDWRTDSGGAGRLAGDGKHGRIYRLTWAGTGDRPALAPRPLDSWARLVKRSDLDLVKALAAEDFSDRRLAREELALRAARKEADVKKVLPALLKLVKDVEEPLVGRIAAVGAIEGFWGKGVAELFVALLQDPNPDLRRLAADGLGRHARPGDRETHEALLQALADDDPAVRRVVVLAVARVNAPGAADVVVSALQFDDGKDVYLHDGILRAVERVGRPAVERLLTLADSGDERDLEKVVAAFRAFRSRAAVEALPALLRKYHLKAAQKAELVRSYDNYQLDPPISLEPLADYLAGLPRPPRGAKLTAKESGEQAELVPVRLAGLHVLASGGRVQGPKARAVVLSLLSARDPRVRVAAAAAAAAMRLAGAVPLLEERLRERSLSPQERVAVRRALDLLRR
jgi:putative membrane-bound dehydrogenase-like protein